MIKSILSEVLDQIGVLTSDFVLSGAIHVNGGKIANFDGFFKKK